MLIFFSLLVICCSFVQPWEISKQKEGQNQLKKEVSLERSSDISSERARVGKIVKSSIFPYLKQDESKSLPIISEIVKPEKVNTTIRLKFGKENLDQVSEGVVGIVTTGNSTEYNTNHNVMNSNEPATPRTQEMSSHRIILYNQTKTQEDTSGTSSNNLLRQLKKFNWPFVDGNQNDINDLTIQKGKQLNFGFITPVAEQKEVPVVEVVNLKAEGVRLKQQKALLEQIKKYLEEHDVVVTTEKPFDMRYKISGPQKRLLTLLYELVQKQEITYDFTDRLVNLFYKHGYQNQLLQVLFDFIMKQIQAQGNSDNQQTIINNLMELWNMLYHQQSEIHKGTLNENKENKPDKQFSEQLKVLKVLQLLNALKESNAKDQHVLRSNYLTELKTLYDTYDNKDHLMKIMYNHWKNQLNKKKSGPIVTKPSDASEHVTNEVDINKVLQYIVNQKGLHNKNEVLVEHDKNTSSLHRIDVEKPSALPRHELWKVLFEHVSKNKNNPNKKPNNLLVVHNIYEEVKDEVYLPTPPAIDTKNLQKFTKNNIKPYRINGKESTKKMYQMLLELLKNKKILNKEELRLKIIEMINKMKSQNVEISSESTPEDLEGIWDLFKKENNKAGTQECVAGTSWPKDCKSCVCMAGGVPVCKEVPDCFIGLSPAKPMQCKPHSNFKLNKCNTCKCNSMGVPICTFMECTEPVTSDSGSKKILPEQEALKAILCSPEKKMPVCAPRTSWRSDCHDCVCDDEGQRHCNVVKNCKIPLDKEYLTTASQTPPP